MYNTYLTRPCAISIEEANRCFKEVYGMTQTTRDEVLKEVYQDFVNACLRYAGIRAKWDSLAREQKQERDSSRTSAHNKVIDTHNILTRYMHKNGLSTEWQTVLGYDAEDRMTRKRLGDFACYVALLLGLEAR